MAAGARSRIAPTEETMATKENSTPAEKAAANLARDKAIDLALAAIDKQFGKGAIMRLGKDPIDREGHVTPTGSVGLEIGLGNRGPPPGATPRAAPAGGGGPAAPALPIAGGGAGGGRGRAAPRARAP